MPSLRRGKRQLRSLVLDSCHALTDLSCLAECSMLDHLDASRCSGLRDVAWLGLCERLTKLCPQELHGRHECVPHRPVQVIMRYAHEYTNPSTKSNDPIACCLKATLDVLALTLFDILTK